MLGSGKKYSAGSSSLGSDLNNWITKPHIQKIETKIEYILPVWNMYLGGFDPETFSFRGSSCPTLNQLG
mgnify:CR=1 FL=1